MKYDDAALERALAALPLEEAPEDLRGRILLNTIGRPAPLFRPWELWVIGAALGVCAWLVLAITGVPATGAEQVRAAIAQASETLVAVLNPALVVWLGIGALAALAVQFSETALAALRQAKP